MTFYCALATAELPHNKSTQTTTTPFQRSPTLASKGWRDTCLHDILPAYIVADRGFRQESSLAFVGCRACVRGVLLVAMTFLQACIKYNTLPSCAESDRIAIAIARYSSVDET